MGKGKFIINDGGKPIEGMMHMGKSTGRAKSDSNKASVVLGAGAVLGVLTALALKKTTKEKQY